MRDFLPRLRSLELREGAPIVTDDHYFDSFRYLLTQHYRTRHRPNWLHPFKRVMWVHRHGPHVPRVREEIPSRFAKLWLEELRE